MTVHSVNRMGILSSKNVYECSYGFSKRVASLSLTSKLSTKGYIIDRLNDKYVLISGYGIYEIVYNDLVGPMNEKILRATLQHVHTP